MAEYRGGVGIVLPGEDLTPMIRSVAQLRYLSLISW